MIYNANQRRPPDYDLVRLKILRKSRDERQTELEEKWIKGWWTGFDWYGVRLLPSDIVVAWEYVWDQS